MHTARPTAPVSRHLRIALAPLSLALLTVMLLPGAAHAQWKWRDKSGQITVSDLPPPRDVPEQNVLQRPSPAAQSAPPSPAASAASAAAPAGKPAPETDLDKRRKAVEQEQAAKAKADDERLAAQRRENCGRARTHLAGLESGQRIARFNDKGEREFLDDRGRAEEIRRTREVIASDCR